VDHLCMKVDNFRWMKTIFNKKNNTMKALKFYDKEGVGFELFMDYERQSIMLQIDNSETEDQPSLEFDDDDIDDIIIALVELKNELVSYRNISNN
jgi:hypothetical protein